MSKIVKSAVVLALLGAAIKYGSKHPKWVEYKSNRLNRLPVTKSTKPESEIIELGRS